jgi:hypothetical protein
MGVFKILINNELYLLYNRVYEGYMYAIVSGVA